MRRVYVFTGVVLFLGAMLLHVTTIQAASVVVRVASAEAAPGGEVAIPITVQGASGIGAMHLELTYDASILEATTVDKGPLLGDNALLDFNTTEPGRLIIGLATLDSIKGDGNLLKIRFMVTGSEGQSSPLQLENTKAWEDENHLDILTSTEGGVFTVSSEGLPLIYLLLLAVLCIGLLLLLLLVALFMLFRKRRRPSLAR